MDISAELVRELLWTKANPGLHSSLTDSVLADWLKLEAAGDVSAPPELVAEVRAVMPDPEYLPEWVEPVEPVAPPAGQMDEPPPLFPGF